MRRRNVLVDGAQAAFFPDMEYTLVRCPKFYAKENLETVFPDAAHVADDATAPAQRDVQYYLLYTFQPSDYVMQKPGKESRDDGDSQDLSSDNDDDFASSGVGSPAGKANEDDFSELIQYTPASVEWKDRSRDRFFQFMGAAKEHIRTQLSQSAGAADGVVAASPTLFMDWPDPATGLPVKSTRGPSTFNDADTIQQFFPWHSVLIAGPGGGCRMVEHPRFGLNVYPAAGVVVVPRCAEEALCDAVRGLAV